MIDVAVHFRGVGAERQTMPTIPPVGSYVYGPGGQRRLWLVEDVVFDGGTVDLYVIEVSARLVEEMTAAWTAWSEGNPI